MTSLRCIGPPVIPLIARGRQPLAHLGFMRGVEQQGEDPAENSTHVRFASINTGALVDGPVRHSVGRRMNPEIKDRPPATRE